MLYSFKKTEIQNLSPEQFGYAALHWAFGHAKYRVNYFDSSPALNRKIEADFFPALMLFKALFTASYWICATIFCQAPNEVMPVLQKGLSEALKDDFDDYGNSLSQEALDNFYNTFNLFFETQLKDIAEVPERGDILFDGNRTAAAFVEKLLDTYAFPMDSAALVMARMQLSQHVMTCVATIYDQTMREQGLVFGNHLGSASNGTTLSQ